MPPETDPNLLLARAKDGDADAREELIRRYTPFVLATVSRATGRYISLSDDEASIGLIAFNEAINSFKIDGGSNFLTLAETIVRRRLIDYNRRESRQNRRLYLQEMEHEMAAAIAEPVSPDSMELIVEIADRKREIEQYKKELSNYGITLKELVHASPQHRDARDRALGAARVVVDNPFFRQYLIERKALPLKALEKAVEASRKTLERHRKYIIAVAVMIMGDYEYLTDYIGQKKGGRVE